MFSVSIAEKTSTLQLLKQMGETRTEKIEKELEMLSSPACLELLEVLAFRTHCRRVRDIKSADMIDTVQQAMKGEDGREYGFLLKGHEDLRQDERAMQLFGLANALLAKDRRTREHGHLSIQRYAVTPLSHNCGVVGWVPACDTLHALVRDFRDALKRDIGVVDTKTGLIWFTAD